MRAQHVHRLREYLAISLVGMTWLCTSCGSAKTSMDERCADLAATGYNQTSKLEALLVAAHQPSQGSIDVLRRRAQSLCLQVGSQPTSQP